jgi:hypothetical protein
LLGQNFNGGKEDRRNDQKNEFDVTRDVNGFDKEEADASRARICEHRRIDLRAARQDSSLPSIESVCE